MSFDIKDQLPIWKQLYLQIKKRIINGTYKVGSLIPTVRDLALEAQVNPNTIQRAMAKLEADRLVITNRTCGKIVTNDTKLIEKVRINVVKSEVKNFIDNMKKIGIKEAEIIKIIKGDMLNEKSKNYSNENGKISRFDR